eukprot:SAG31_NODE_541_length_14275_cov_6.690886_12_plen_624_part_00
MVVAQLDPEHASLVVGVFFVFLIVWIQYLIRRLVDATDLRTAVRMNAVIRMDQLGRIPIEFSLLTRRHFQQLLRMKQPPRPKGLGKVDVPFGIVDASLKISDAGITFDVDVRRPVSAQIIWGVGRSPEDAVQKVSSWLRDSAVADLNLRRGGNSEGMASCSRGRNAAAQPHDSAEAPQLRRSRGIGPGLLRRRVAVGTVSCDTSVQSNAPVEPLAGQRSLAEPAAEMSSASSSPSADTSTGNGGITGERSESIAISVQATADDSGCAMIDSSKMQQYIVEIHRHPEHGLGITLDSDAQNNAFVDALVDQPDGQPGCAETAGVILGSLIVAVGDIRVFGQGASAVGAAVGEVLGGGVLGGSGPLPLTLLTASQNSTGVMQHQDFEQATSAEGGETWTFPVFAPHRHEPIVMWFADPQRTDTSRHTYKTEHEWWAQPGRPRQVLLRSLTGNTMAGDSVNNVSASDETQTTGNEDVSILKWTTRRTESGFGMILLVDEDAQNVLVNTVQGAAEQFGVPVGSIIHSVCGHLVQTPAQLLAFVEQIPMNSQVEFEFRVPNADNSVVSRTSDVELQPVNAPSDASPSDEASTVVIVLSSPPGSRQAVVETVIVPVFAFWMLILLDVLQS